MVAYSRTLAELPLNTDGPLLQPGPQIPVDRLVRLLLLWEVGGIVDFSSFCFIARVLLLELRVHVLNNDLVHVTLEPLVDLIPAVPSGLKSLDSSKEAVGQTANLRPRYQVGELHQLAHELDLVLEDGAAQGFRHLG